MSCARSKVCFHFTAYCACSPYTSACSEDAAAHLAPACCNQASLACSACTRLEQCSVQEETHATVSWSQASAAAPARRHLPWPWTQQARRRRCRQSPQSPRRHCRRSPTRRRCRRCPLMMTRRTRSVAGLLPR